jgi:hypothetical protein
MEARLFVVTAALSCAPAIFCTRPAVAAEPTKDECIDANETAQTLAHGKKLVAAKQRLLVCMSPGCPKPVRDDCGQRLTDVEAMTPTLVLEVKDDAEHDLSAVRVTMDAQPFVSKLDGTAIPLDPGEHQFVFEADGLKSEQRTLVVREGDKNRHERVVLVGAARAPGATPLPQVPEGAAPQAPSDGRTQRIAGLALGGAGVVGVVVGSIFGLMSKATYDGTSNHCGAHIGLPLEPNKCDQQGYSDGQTAHNQATVSTVAFIVGPALLAGGAYLYFTAPKAEVAVAPTVGNGGATLSLRGRW